MTRAVALRNSALVIVPYAVIYLFSLLLSSVSDLPLESIDMAGGEEDSFLEALASAVAMGLFALSPLILVVGFFLWIRCPGRVVRGVQRFVLIVLGCFIVSIS